MIFQNASPLYAGKNPPASMISPKNRNVLAMNELQGAGSPTSVGSADPHNLMLKEIDAVVIIEFDYS